MTTESLYDTLSYIVDTDEKLRLQAGLRSVASSLTSLVQQPAQPNHQQALASALAALDAAATALKRNLTPFRMEQIKELGGGEFFDPALASEIKQILQ